MLRVESEKQVKHIVSLLGRTSIIDQDEMAMIVDYLRAKKT